MKPRAILAWFLVAACWLSVGCLLGSAGRADELPQKAASSKEQAEGKPILRRGAIGRIPAEEAIILRPTFIRIQPAIIHADDDAEEKPVQPKRAVMLLGDDILEQLVFRQRFVELDQRVIMASLSESRKQLDAILAQRLEDINKACKLNDGQKKKLELARRGDMKRFYDRYEQIRRKFPLDQGDPKFPQAWQEIQQEIEPLQTSLQNGLLGDDSLLVKSLRNTLTPEQFARYEASSRERAALRHRAAIETVVGMFGRATPLREEQRRALINLLSKSTKPSPKPGQYDQHVVLFQMGRLPDEQLKPLFDDAQWKAISQQLVLYKRMEASLKQMGVLPDEED